MILSGLALASDIDLDEASGTGFTVGYDCDSGLLGVWPVLEDLSDPTLVLYGDILKNGMSSSLASSKEGCVTHQTLGTSEDVGVVETGVAHSRGVYQGGNFGKVVSAQLVEHVDVRILELGEELEGFTRSGFILRSESSRQALTIYFSRGEVLDRSCAKERRKWVSSSYAGGKRPFKASGVSKL